MYNPQALNRYAYALNNPIRYTDPSGHMVACGSDSGNGCAGTGLGGLTPSQILQSNANDDIKNKAIYNYSVTHPDYNYNQDPEIEDAGKFIVANAIFLGNADYVSRMPDFWDRVSASWGTLAHGGSLAIAAILTGGNYQSPDDGGGGGWPAGGNGRQEINGITYTEHALDQMEPVGFGGRGVPPSAVENAIKFGTRSPGKYPGTIRIVYENVTVITNDDANLVITVIKTGH